MTINAEAIYKADRFQEEALPHMDSVYRYALYMARNENDAQDLVQDTYLRAYRFFDSFRAGTNCKAWLTKILRNTFINTMRHDRKRPQMIHLSEINDQGTELSGVADPEDTIFGSLFDDDVNDAMDSLPGRFKTVVLLADIDGFSYKEIADMVGCPTGQSCPD